MTKVSLLALLAVVVLVLLPAIAFAQGGLYPPCAFHGTVQVNGQNVADGTVIRATIGNTTYTTTTTTVSSNSTYRIVIAQPEGKSYDGLTVTFMIGNATAGQTGTWQMGGNVALNLTVLYPPCAFHGTVQVNGQNVADGTVITATIGNDTYTTTTGNSTYRIVIAQPEGKSYDGLTVTFIIGNGTAGQTGTWQMGGNVALNLTVSTPTTTSTPTPTTTSMPTPTPTPAGKTNVWVIVGPIIAVIVIGLVVYWFFIRRRKH